MEVNLPPISESAVKIYHIEKEEDRFDAIAKKILENPMCALAPTLPALHEALFSKDKRQKQFIEFCTPLGPSVRKAPFFQTLSQLPALFLEQYRAEDKFPHIKEIGSAYLNREETILGLIFNSLKSRLLNPKPESVWVKLVDTFIDELETARASQGMDHKEIDNPMTHFLIISFLRFKAMLTNKWGKPLIDLAVSNYSYAPNKVKTLIRYNINRYFEVSVKKTGEEKKLLKNRKLVVQMIYEVVDAFLLESQHLVYYKDCVADLITVVHGEGMDKEMLQKKYLGGLWRILDDFENSDKLKKALWTALQKVDDIADL